MRNPVMGFVLLLCSAGTSFAGWLDAERVERRDGTRYYDVVCRDGQTGREYFEQITATDVLNGNVCRAVDRANFLSIERVRGQEGRFRVTCVDQQQPELISGDQLRRNEYCLNPFRPGRYQQRGNQDSERDFFLKVYKNRAGTSGFVSINRGPLSVTLRCQGFRCFGEQQGRSVELRSLKQVQGVSSLWLRLGNEEPKIFLREPPRRLSMASELKD